MKKANEVTNKKTPSWAIILAWVFVFIPLIWGVVQTLLKSFALFR